MPHVFISYVRENQKEVDRLCDDLTKQGVKVWLDRMDIEPGVDRRQAIRRAIEDGAFLIACFSKQHNEREENYMNEELTLAIDRLRKFSTDRTWFIPVKLNKCKIPRRRISDVETLQDLQYVELYKDWEGGLRRVLNTIQINPSANIAENLLEEIIKDDVQIEPRWVHVRILNSEMNKLYFGTNIVREEETISPRDLDGLWRGSTGKLEISTKGDDITGKYDWRAMNILAQYQVG